MRTVDHRVVLVDGRDGRLAAQHQARHLRLPPHPSGENLVATHSRADLAAGGKVGAGEQVAGLATVDAADEGFLVVQPAQEQQFLAEGPERLQHLAELHVLALAFGPPLLAVEAVAGEQAGESYRRLRGGVLRPVIAPYRERFQPRQGHRHADAAQEGPAGKGLGDLHGI